MPLVQDARIVVGGVRGQLFRISALKSTSAPCVAIACTSNLLLRDGIGVQEDWDLENLTGDGIVHEERVGSAAVGYDGREVRARGLPPDQ